MSLTEAQHVFAGVHEHGINTFLRAVFTARPHYLSYGTTPFVTASSAAATLVPTIAFPGVPGGIPYDIQFAIPTIDLFPADPDPDPIPPGIGQFTVHTAVRLTVGCMDWQPGGQDRRPSLRPISTNLDVWARGHLFVFDFGGGNGVVGFDVEEIKIPDLRPASLEAVLECIIRMMLKAALHNVRLPFAALRMGAFNLVLDRGPEIADDQIKLWGHV